VTQYRFYPAGGRIPHKRDDFQRKTPGVTGAMLNSAAVEDGMGDPQKAHNKERK